MFLFHRAAGGDGGGAPLDGGTVYFGIVHRRKVKRKDGNASAVNCFKVLC